MLPLSNEESSFIYDLCVAAVFLIITAQGGSLYVVPGANHLPDDVSGPDDTVWVNSITEM